MVRAYTNVLFVKSKVDARRRVGFRSTFIKLGDRLGA